MKKVNILLLTLFLFLSKNYSFAVGSFYTENDYERTSTYAGITENDERLDVNDMDKISEIQENNKAKKVYNTIIVRKKNSKNKNIPQQKNEIKIPEITVRPVNEADDRLDEYIRKKKKKSMFSSLFKTTPDRFYIYALASYSVSLTNHFDIGAVQPSNVESYNDFKQKSFSTERKGNGFGFIVGTKIYLNKNKFAMFIAPELFYNNLNLSNNNFNYNSAHSYLASDGGGAGNPDIKEDYTPTTMSIKTKDMYGGSLRLGFTILNTVSLYGKASIGGLRNGINGKITDLGKNARAIEQWKNPENSYYVNRYQSMNKTSLFYGFGAGIEFSLLNQHIVIRLDYDYYFGSGIFSLDGMSKVGEPGKQSTEIKWKVKNNFGIAKLTVGFAF